MPCYHPLKAFKVRPETRDQSAKYVIASHKLEHVNYKGQSYYESIDIPCGKCIGCRLEYSKQWANRIMLESKTSNNIWGINLTYNNDNIPIKHPIDLETGEVITSIECPTLKEKDVQDFLKRLRMNMFRKYGTKSIRYAYAGEYGEQRQRPHYHLIVFNCPIKDLKEVRKSKKNFPMYESEEISKTWGKGLVTINEVSWDYSAYVARYIMKKQKGQGSKEYYDSIGREKEYFRTSRRPGLGKEYYNLNKDKIYDTDEIFLGKRDKVLKLKPAKYYDKLFDVEDHERMQEIKENRRKSAEDKIKIIKNILNNEITYEEYLEIQERTKQEQVKSLRRNMENGTQ